jgi:lysophospholipase L1-like esterase
VSLPSFSEIALLRIEIDEEAELRPHARENKPVYVALGDSITHGTGQGNASHLSYPFLLSRKLDFTLYNLAVGGSGVPVGVGPMLGDFPRIDLITVLVGYNDWNGEGKTPAEYYDRYRQLLLAVRASHPKAVIVCISPLYTARQLSKITGLTIDPFREVVYRLVREFQDQGDQQIYLVKGETITGKANLRDGGIKDPVHLSVEGAAQFAEQLHQWIRESLGNTLFVTPAKAGAR